MQNSWIHLSVYKDYRDNWADYKVCALSKDQLATDKKKKGPDSLLEMREILW